MASMMQAQPYREESQINNILKCPDCQEDPPNLIEEFSSGDMVCASCGLVVSDLRSQKIKSLEVKFLSGGRPNRRYTVGMAHIRQ